MHRDPWTRLGLLGTGLTASLLFVHVPATLWSGNTAEFHARFATFAAIGLIAVLITLGLASLLLKYLPRPARAAVACLISAIGLIGWAYAYFIGGHMTVLNGQDAPMVFETLLGAWEVPLVAAACLLIALAIARIPRLATQILIALNVGLIAISATTVLSARGARTQPNRAAVTPESPIFRFSARENVLLVLLDGLQADVADEILAREPALANAFDGFHFYKDTAGVAPTTFISLPALHSGDLYRPPEHLAAYFSEAIGKHSFLNRFADAGYDATLINPVEGVCPHRVANCVAAATVLHSRVAQVRADALRLLDLSLFRLAPVRVKRWIYNGGNWLVAGRMGGLPEEVSRILEGNALIREVARRMVVKDGPPTVKFLHSFSTHTPYLLSDNCKAVANISLDRLEPQARCALLAVARLLDRMRATGVYDNSVILVMADHGMKYGSRYASERAWHDTARANLAGAANPVFLLKLRGERGPLREVAGAVHLPDVPATLCAASGACIAPSGLPAGAAPGDRPRAFFDYEWKHEYWSQREIPNMTTYQIRGPLWSPQSWARGEGILTHHLTEE